MSEQMIGLASVDPAQLSALSRQVLRLQEEVMGRWKALVAQTLAKAAELHEPILENTLPSLMDSLALLLTPAYVQRAAIDISVIAIAHGDERARLTGYDTTTLIHELQLLRSVLMETLHAAGVALGAGEAGTIHTAIDSAIRESANAFATAQAALREQFAAALAHDLRTPLSNAHLAAQLIQRASSLQQAQGLAARILQNTSRIEDMATQMLDNLLESGAAAMPLRIEQFDMAALVAEVAEHTASFHGVDLQVLPASAHGYWCRSSLQRAIENMISNAIKHGAPNTPVQLWVHLTSTRVKVSVHNDGPPIPVEMMESIFQLYLRAEQARRKSVGWGVGLSFIRHVAEAHGGSVHVSSTVRDGTTFALDLPIDARPFAGKVVAHA
ncbi:sensor histidine kinase [Pseudoduganella sp. GCM10020061]|uniref:sensor histidine kinase n=1 Tax=Pseudoduganella sp. GCM10020061 TaxID=3317345 RepID=UPI003638E488